MSINGSTPVKSAGLSTRATNTLARAGFRTLEEVAHAGLGEIRAILDIGKVSLAEIDRALVAAGLGELELKPDHQPPWRPHTAEAYRERALYDMASELAGRLLEACAGESHYPETIRGAILRADEARLRSAEANGWSYHPLADRLADDDR